MYEAYLKFSEGWGGLRKNPFCGGGMDISGITHFSKMIFFTCQNWHYQVLILPLWMTSS